MSEHEIIITPPRGATNSPRPCPHRPVHKVTILRAVGTGIPMVLPTRTSTPRRGGEPRKLPTDGGRAAEEMVFHDPTTVQQRIEKATALARAMVTQYAMTERSRDPAEDNSEPFLGRDMGTAGTTRGRRRTDKETKRFLDTAPEAFDILARTATYRRLVMALLDKGERQGGRGPRARPLRAAPRGPLDGRRTGCPSTIPPIETAGDRDRARSTHQPSRIARLPCDPPGAVATAR